VLKGGAYSSQPGLAGAGIGIAKLAQDVLTDLWWEERECAGVGVYLRFPWRQQMYTEGGKESVSWFRPKTCLYHIIGVFSRLET